MKELFKKICQFFCISTNVLGLNYNTKILAHRGFTKHFQENTLGAFHDAINLDNIAGIEFDVMYTLDKIPVCIHDNNLKRLTGLDKEVKDILFQDLSKLKIKNDIGNNIIYKTNPKIPTLEETLDLFKNKNKILNLELKIDYFSKEFVDDVLSLIYKYQMQDRTIITSFNHNLLDLIDKKQFLLGSINDFDICHNDLNKMNLDYPIVILDKRTNSKILKLIKNQNKIIGIYTINSYDDNLKDNINNYDVDYLIFDQF